MTYSLIPTLRVESKVVTNALAAKVEQALQNQSKGKATFQLPADHEATTKVWSK